MSDNKELETMLGESNRTEALNRQLPPTNALTPMPKVKPVSRRNKYNQVT
ncbi:MAG: hypothetical protein GQ475_00255 [Methylococcaceae bacterium]|nr:hypothetical protein [Methylococcaceae bacterium]